jgi:hypothetical protein
MTMRLGAEQQPVLPEGSRAGSENQEQELQGLPAEWTFADLKDLADKVYDLMLQDLLLERERGAW